MSVLALLGGPKAIRDEPAVRQASRWPIFSEEAKKAVWDTLEQPDLYQVIRELEEAFAAYHDVPFALAHCNGTSSLYTAYFAVGVGPGDEVIAPAYTWHLEVEPILALGAVPVFCDVDPRDGCADPDDIRRKVGPRTKAISVAHIFGAVAQMDQIMKIAKERNIAVIEDCSHAHGATFDGQKVGTIGDIGCFSLQASKLMTAIEGGIFITKNQHYYERACVLGHYERIRSLTDPDLRKYADPEKEQAPACLGYKFRIHPLGAAIALVQLRHLDETNQIRDANMRCLCRIIEEVGDGILTPPYERKRTQRVWFEFHCRYHEEAAGVPRQLFIQALRAEGLPVSKGRAGYLPVYWNPLYYEYSSWGKKEPVRQFWSHPTASYSPGMCPVAETLWRSLIQFPVFHRPLPDGTLNQVGEAIAKVIRGLPALGVAEKVL